MAVMALPIHLLNLLPEGFLILLNCLPDFLDFRDIQHFLDLVFCVFGRRRGVRHRQNRICGSERRAFDDCRFVADHILYDGKEIGTDSLSDYSAEDMFNSPGWEGEIDEI